MYAVVITAAVLLGAVGVSFAARRRHLRAVDDKIKYQCLWMSAHIWPLLNRLYKSCVADMTHLKIERSPSDIQGLPAWYDEATNTIHLSRKGSPSHPPAFWHASELHKAYRHLAGLPASFTDEPLKDDRLKATLIQIRLLETVYRCLSDLRERGEL